MNEKSQRTTPLFYETRKCVHCGSHFTCSESSGCELCRECATEENEMTEKLKTRSEVLAELEAAKRIIDGLPGLEVDIITSNGCFVFGVEDSDERVISDHIKFTPDPDTKIQALEKAHKLQMGKEKDSSVAWCSCARHGSDSSRYSVQWYDNNESSVVHKDFPFFDPAPKSEYITDEPPPKGVEVEVYSYGEKVLRYSWGKFHADGSLMVTARKNRDKNPVSHKTYRSLTTPHRSKDWVD